MTDRIVLLDFRPASLVMAIAVLEAASDAARDAGHRDVRIEDAPGGGYRITATKDTGEDSS